jgi:alpha-galactosidase
MVFSMRNLVFFAAMASGLFAQSPAGIRQINDRKLWVLDTGLSTYVVGLNERNELQFKHWGGRVLRDDDLGSVHTSPEWASFDASESRTPEEYPGWGGIRYVEPAVKVTFADGNRDLVLKYSSAAVMTGENTLSIRLKDIRRDVFVNVLYRVYPGTGVLAKSSVIENRTNQPLVVESAQSGIWYMPRGTNYRMSHLYGRWAGETQLVRETLQPGKKVIESRRGNTGQQFNPWFAVDTGDADETHGRVWFGALAWSGNWKITAETTPFQITRVIGGFNDFDFGYKLNPGEQLKTPAFYGGYTEGGFGEASRILHHFERTQIAPDRAHPHVRPLLYNSWEATTFAVDEPGQAALAEKAAKLGVELFVMDDGWFGQRYDDHRGLGDWYVNKQKFPNGLKPLIDRVNALGMKFGLWVEPEMVNPDSDLYRAHPDWAMHFPDRPRSEARNQLVLNMARQDVKEHIFGLLDRLLTENKIEFLKWDMNRNFGEPGWPAVPPDEEKKLWVQYVRNVYEIIDRLRANHPGVEIESCSGGGGRVDLGILERVDQVWTSDNTEAYDRLRIQEGFSQAYPAKVMMAWITDVPNMNGRSTPLKYRFLVAMQGSVGIGGNLNHWSAEDMKLASTMVNEYKGIREVVQQGDLYRLSSPRDPSGLTSNEYLSPDRKKAAIFAFYDHQQYGQEVPVIYPRGLDPSTAYQLRSIDNRIVDGEQRVGGAYLMSHGLQLKLTGDYDCTLIVLDRVHDAPPVE